MKFTGINPVCALTAVRSLGSQPEAQTYRHTGRIWFLLWWIMGNHGCVWKKLYFNQHFVFVVPISSKIVKSGVLAAESPKELLSQSYRWMCLKNRSGTGNCFQTCRFPWTWVYSSTGRTTKLHSVSGGSSPPALTTKEKEKKRDFWKNLFSDKTKIL